jgi:hypothetical protein
MAALYGYSVPGGIQPYDLNVEFPMAGASPFSVSGAPSSVDPWMIYTMNVSYDLPNVAGLYQGYVSFGVMGSNNTIRIPLMINLIDLGAPVLEPISPMDGETISDPTPTIEIYFNDTAAYSGLNMWMIIVWQLDRE